MKVSSAEHIFQYLPRRREFFKWEWTGIKKLAATLPSGTWCKMIHKYRNHRLWSFLGKRSRSFGLSVCAEIHLYMFVDGHFDDSDFGLEKKRTEEKKENTGLLSVLALLAHTSPPEEVIGRVCFPEIKGCSPHPQSWKKLAMSALAFCSCNRPCQWHWEKDRERERASDTEEWVKGAQLENKSEVRWYWSHSLKQLKQLGRFWEVNVQLLWGLQLLNGVLKPL